MRHRVSCARPGLTLLEVVVSMFIFLIAVTAIWQLMSSATDRALDVKLQAQTSMGCQAKLAEVMIGAQDLMSVESYQAFPEGTDASVKANQNLKWKMKATQASVVGLWDVQVWVMAETPSGRTIESTIARQVMEPTLRGSTMDRPEPPPTPVPTEDAPVPK